MHYHLLCIYFQCRIVYNLCTLKYEPVQANLYDRYSKSIRQYLEENVAANIKNERGVEVLTSLNKKWQDHEIMVKWM